MNKSSPRDADFPLSVRDTHLDYRIDSSKSIKEVEAQLLAIPEFALDLKRREKLLQGHEAGK